MDFAWILRRGVLEIIRRVLQQWRQDLVVAWFLGHETPLGVPRSDSQQGWSDIEFVPKVFYLLTPIRLWPLLAL